MQSLSHLDDVEVITDFSSPSCSFSMASQPPKTHSWLFLGSHPCHHPTTVSHVDNCGTFSPEFPTSRLLVPSLGCRAFFPKHMLSSHVHASVSSMAFLRTRSRFFLKHGLQGSSASPSLLFVLCVSTMWNFFHHRNQALLPPSLCISCLFHLKHFSCGSVHKHQLS